MTELVPFNDFIDLSMCRKCAEGSQREIYEHPRAANVLIKVLKASGRAPGGERKTKRLLWFRKYRRFGAYMTFRREIEEYLEQARKLGGGEPFTLPVARILGFVYTSSGLGLVVERIANSTGHLAPTLTQLLLDEKLERRHFDLIDRFFETCSTAHIVLMDINPANFVVTDRSGVDELVCVDGTGEKNFLRLYASSRLMNCWRLHFARKKLLRKIERTAENAASLRRGAAKLVLAEGARK
jgi:hypothetical protein